MNTTDVRATFQLIDRLWPKAEWPAELVTACTREVARLPIDYVQAEAALTALRLRMAWRTIQPSEVLDALNRAAHPVVRAGDNRHDADARAKVEGLLTTDRTAFFRLTTVTLDMHRELPRSFVQTADAMWRNPSARACMAALIDTGAVPPDYVPVAEAFDRALVSVEKSAHLARGYWAPEAARRVVYECAGTGGGGVSV